MNNRMHTHAHTLTHIRARTHTQFIDSRTQVSYTLTTLHMLRAPLMAAAALAVVAATVALLSRLDFSVS